MNKTQEENNLENSTRILLIKLLNEYFAILIIKNILVLHNASFTKIN